VTLRTLRRIALAGIVLVVALAAWELPRRPVVAALLLAVAAAVAFTQVRAQRLMKRLHDAGLRCDLPELDVTRRLARLAWDGRGDEAMRLADAEGVVADGLLGDYRTRMRLVNRFLAVALAPSEDSRDPETRAWFDVVIEELVAPGMPWVLWPMRLAAAVEALRRGDEAAARKHAEGMPSWPDGTPLERTRRDLVARLDGRDAA
jgi:hypothetical protein